MNLLFVVRSKLNWASRAHQTTLRICSERARERRRERMFDFICLFKSFSVRYDGATVTPKSVNRFHAKMSSEYVTGMALRGGGYMVWLHGVVRCSSI